MKTYVISDTHFNHKNIIAYCNRPFYSVEEMDAALIKNWNKMVKKDDTIYCLGDFCLGKKETIREIVPKLHGRKILIMGNHDHATKSFYLEAGFEEVYGEELDIEYNGLKVKLSHHRKDGGDECEFINVYGHVHDKPEDDSKHKCACVELWDYSPVLLDTLIK